MMWKEQVRNDLPVLAKEAAEICEKLGVEDVNFSHKNKKSYIKEVKEACTKVDEREMKTEMMTKKKLKK